MPPLSCQHTFFSSPEYQRLEQYTLIILPVFHADKTQYSALDAPHVVVPPALQDGGYVDPQYAQDAQYGYEAQYG